MVSRTVQLTTLLLLSLGAILVPVGYSAYLVYIGLSGEGLFEQIGPVLPAAAYGAIAYALVINHWDSILAVITGIAGVGSLAVLIPALWVLIRHEPTEESATHNTR
jgi:hypothetical protein